MWSSAKGHHRPDPMCGKRLDRSCCRAPRPHRRKLTRPVVRTCAHRRMGLLVTRMMCTWTAMQRHLQIRCCEGVR